MKAKCPACEAVYNIDDAKIPEKGVYATCKKCNERFQVKKQGGGREEKHEDVIITCPYCSRVNISSDKCAGCGKLFSEEEKAKLTIKI